MPVPGKAAEAVVKNQFTLDGGRGGIDPASAGGDERGNERIKHAALLKLVV